MRLPPNHFGSLAAPDKCQKGILEDALHPTKFWRGDYEPDICCPCIFTPWPRTGKSRFSDLRERELLGHGRSFAKHFLRLSPRLFYQPRWRDPQPLAASDHPSLARGSVVPFGCYDGKKFTRRDLGESVFVAD